MEKKSRLGRGLNSLLSSTGAVSQSSSSPNPEPQAPPEPAPVFENTDPVYHPDWEPIREFKEIPVDRVWVNLSQPRREFDEVALKSLADSISNSGVLQPILVEIDHDRYRLIAGERRWRAAQMCHLKTIPAIIRTVDSVQRSVFALIENIHREDLNPIERATAYKTMLDNWGLTHAELSMKLTEERSTITNFTRLLELPESVQKMVTNGSLSLGHAKLLVTVESPSEQVRLAGLVAKEHLSVRNLERILRNRPSPGTVSTPSIPPAASAHIAELQRQISRDLQMRTEVREGKKAGKGRLIIHYASLDQFDQLMQRLNVKIDD